MQINMLNLVNIQKLNDNNFKTWKQKIVMNFGVLEFSIAFKMPQPSTLTNSSSAQDWDNFAKWEGEN